MVFFLFECVVELFFFFQEDLIQVKGTRMLRQGMRLVYSKCSLLFTELKLVPLNIGIGNEKLLSSSLHVSLIVIRRLQDRVEKMKHFVFHEIVNHYSLSQNGVPR